jgi:hypothetical protein
MAASTARALSCALRQEGHDGIDGGIDPLGLRDMRIHQFAR